MRVRVALSAHDSLTRQLLRVALAARDITTVAEAASTGELVVLCLAEQPDVVILLNDMVDEVAEAIGQLAEAAIDVLVVAADATPAAGLDLLAAGAVGFITRNVGIDGLVSAIHDIRSGGCPLDPRCAAPLVAEWRVKRDAATSPIEGLSKRELDVLKLIASGASAKTMATALGVSVKTVENHKTRIFSKLGVRSQAQAAMVAMASGVVDDLARTRTAER